MGYKEYIQPGTKTATALSARIIQARTGTQGIEVTFTFSENGKDETLAWIGWLSEDAFDFTQKTCLDVLGLDLMLIETYEDGSSMQGYVKGLDTSRGVELVIVHEIFEGETSTRIKYINSPGGSAFRKLEPEKVKSTFAWIRGRAKGVAGAAPSIAQTAKKAVPEEPLPF